MAFESNIVRAIKRALKRHGKKRIKFIKIHGDSFTEKGTPDIIGCYRSICFVLECKNERGQVSPIQKLRLKEWHKAGAVTGIPRSVQEAVETVIHGINLRKRKDFDGAGRDRGDSPAPVSSRVPKRARRSSLP